MRREMLLNSIVLTLCCFCVLGAIQIEDHSRSVSEKPTLVDTYGNLGFNDERARFDNLAERLSQEPTVKGYIIGYGGKDRGRKCEGLARGNRARLWLTEMRGIEAGRLTVVDGGFRDTPWTELWIVRQDDEIPQPSQAVDKKTVRFSGPSLCGPAGRSFERKIITNP